ncbi:MAG TPA: hypothetical protein VLC09_11460 [Polyangiaceae bacterium]|nr:hypothetical protein [Polyangiaceae bacterium]
MKTYSFVELRGGRAWIWATRLVFCLGCASGGGVLGGCASTPPAASETVPPPVESDALCVLSADCPAGLHCDLGECIQECNSELPCAGEGRSCSERARCLEEGERDVEPPPPGESLGELQVQPEFLRLDPASDHFSFRVGASADGPVRYRLSTQGDFFEIEAERGTVEGEKELSFALLPAQETGRERSATVRIFTELGERVVHVVQPPGVAGTYQGAMSYRSGGVSLGEARVGLTIRQQGNDLDVGFDPHASLLFPRLDEAMSTGFGNVSEGTGIEFTVQQTFAKELGGARNHFGREIGRRLSVRLEPSVHGSWQGTFREQWYGMGDRVLELEGTIGIYRRFGAPPDELSLGHDAMLPAFEPQAPPYSEVLGGPSASCSELFAKHYGARWREDRRTMLQSIADDYYALDGTIERRFETGTSYEGIAEACATEYRAEQAPEPDGLVCAWLPLLACGALEAAGGVEQREAFPELFDRLVHAAVAPAVLEAQQHAVVALERSLAPGGLTRERLEYDAALAALAPLVRWTLQPTIQGYFVSRVHDEASDARVRALETLGRLISLASTLDAERTRLSLRAATSSQEQAVIDAQSSALLGLLEAAMLLRASAPLDGRGDGVCADVTGLLDPLDSAFGALLDGARSFGVPEGFVPFVYRAGESAGNNFEQMLELSRTARATQAGLEESYLSYQRAYESSELALLHEGLELQAGYQLQLARICGDAFVVEGTEPPDYATCGREDAGELGVLLLQVKQADERLKASEARLRGFVDKIGIDQQTLMKSHELQSSALDFVDRANRTINSLTLSEGMLDLAIQAIEIAANSSLFNGGAPAAMAAASMIVGIEKLGMTVAKQELAQAQEMRLARTDLQVQVLEGMANIKKQVIDAGQLSLEINQDALLKQEAVARAKNLLDDAKRVVGLIRRSNAVAARDPARDPTFRLLRDQRAMSLIEARARTQRQLLLVGRALEYEVNTPLPGMDEAVLAARSHLDNETLAGCFDDIHTSHRIAYGAPQQYVSDVSVRRMLGITGPRRDAVTGEELSEGEQFRAITQRSQAFEPDGSLLLTFATNLEADNGLWAADVCSDRITGVAVQLVGDGLGDAEAQVNLALSGAALLRSCGSDETLSWSLGDGSGASEGIAVIQAGVNDFGRAAPNHSLYGQAVARATWRLRIPAGVTAPTNADLDLAGLDDVVLRIEHQAVPRRSTPLFVDTSCLFSGK